MPPFWALKRTTVETESNLSMVFVPLEQTWLLGMGDEPVKWKEANLPGFVSFHIPVAVNTRTLEPGDELVLHVAPAPKRKQEQTQGKDWKQAAQRELKKPRT